MNKINKISLKNIIKKKWDLLTNEKSQHIYIASENFYKNSEEIKKELNTENYLIFNLNSTLYPTAYYPIIEILKSAIKNETQKSFIKKYKNIIYPTHLSLWINFLFNGIADRDEDIIFNEFHYESKLFRKSLFALFIKIFETQKTIININNVHLCSKSTLSFLEKLTEKADNVFFILTFKKNYTFSNESDSRNWKNFLIHIDENFYVLENKSDINLNETPIENILSLEISTCEIEKNIITAYNNKQLFALEEAKDCALNIYQYIQYNLIAITPYYNFILLRTLGDIFFFLNKYELAYQYYNNLLNFSIETDNKSIIALSYLKIATLELANDNIETCNKLLNKSSIILEGINDDYLLIKLILLKSFLYQKLITTKLHDDNEHLDILDFLQQSIKFASVINQPNSLNAINFIYAYCIGQINPDYNKQLKILEVIIKKAKSSKNLYRVSIAYDLLGAAYRQLNKNIEALYFFKKGNKLKTILGSSYEISQSFNGLGYQYFVMGKYSQAFKSYISAIEFLKKTFHADEIAITIYNIAKTFFYANIFSIAIDYFELTIKIMNILQVDFLKFFPKHQVLIFLAISYIKQDKIEQSINIYNKIVRITNEEERFHYLLLEALIASEKKYFTDAEKSFKSMEKIINNYIAENNEFPDYCTMLFYYEYGLFLDKNNKDENAKEIFHMGKNLCKKIHHNYYADLFNYNLKLISKKPSKPKFYSNIITSESILDSIYSKLEKIEQEKDINKLYYKINEINFLNNLQSILGRSYIREKLTNDVMRLLANRYFVDESYLIVKTDDSWQFAFSSINITTQKKEIMMDIVKEIERSHKEIIITSANLNNYYFKLKKYFTSLIALPLISHEELTGIIICTSNRKDVNYSIDDIRILSIASRQFSVALEKIDLIEKLKELDKLKNDFITNVTHDFRSPLTVILNMADIAIRFNKSLNKKTRESFDIIYKASMKLKSTIDKLLELSKMDAEKLELKISKLNLKDFIGNIVDFYRSSIIGKNININAIIPEKEIENIYSDISRLEEVINNIISNAIKFVDPANGTINIAIIDTVENVIIKISDNGIGIPTNKLDSIFNRFEQAKGGKDSIYKGTGIGLAYAKQMLKFLKGKIWAESEGEGKGATFFIELKKGRNLFDKISDEIRPHILKNKNELKNILHFEFEERNISREIDVDIKELNKKDQYDPYNGIIMIVDDNSNVRNLIKKYLHEHGYKNFLLATNGEDALKAAKKYSPDIIISDINMPFMKGDQFFKKYKESQFYKPIPFIFLSAVIDKEIILEQKKEGVSAYLKKPIDEQELNITVDLNLKIYFDNLQKQKDKDIDVLTSFYKKNNAIDIFIKNIISKPLSDISIIVIEVDNFNKIENEMGIEFQNNLVKKISSALKESTKKDDFSCRFSSDKFCFLFYEIDIKSLKSIGKRLKKNLDDLLQGINQNNDLKFNLTSSFAIVSMLESEKYITQKIGFETIHNYFEISNDINILQEKFKMIIILIFQMAEEILTLDTKYKCFSCNFEGIFNETDAGNTCPVCNSLQFYSTGNKFIEFNEITIPSY